MTLARTTIRAINAAWPPWRLILVDMPRNGRLLDKLCCVCCSVSRAAGMADFRSKSAMPTKPSTSLAWSPADGER